MTKKVPTVPRPPGCPSWVKYTAMDSSGEIYGFAKRPQRGATVWWPVGGYGPDEIDPIRLKSVVPEWQASLRKIK